MGHWQVECPKNAPGAHFAQEAPLCAFTFPVQEVPCEAVRSDVYPVENLPVWHAEKQDPAEGMTFLERIKDRPKIKFGFSDFAKDYK